ncbi:gram-negative bacteria-binding protein 1 isoform X2 [Drosophila tropicalis]|uniref:gram-negative bacteria-binding protein 1 isoform X2 n=1 Tax=Drosophila tropicalis TaxID=46794 RepID=UPI0035ABAE03
MRKLNYVIFLMLWFTAIDGYKVPQARVELLSNGFRVSIPDEPGVKRVAFNVNRNRNFTSFTLGQFSHQLREPQEGLWYYDFITDNLKAYDILHIWTSVQHENALFRDFENPLEVCRLGGKFVPKDCSNTSDETTGSIEDTDSQALPPQRSPEKCEPTITEISSPRSATPLCKDQLIFEENFDTLNESRWSHEVRFPLDTNDAEFVLYDGKARIEEGHLVIEPILWSSYRPDLSINDSHLDLSERCTGTHNRQKECILQTFGSGPSGIMPPIVVPRLNTKESFAFKYGRIEIRAKMPKGDWLVPLLLLEPFMEWYGQTGYESGQLRIAMARGNSQLRLPRGKPIDGHSLYGGPVLTTAADHREDFWATQRRKSHFGDAFHVYGLDWTSQGLRFSVDGVFYGDTIADIAASDFNPSWRRGGPMAPFDRMFYLTLGVSVGGFGDFVDNLRTSNYEKPWRNAHPQAKLQFWQSKDLWQSTWKSPKLVIDYVRVYATDLF